MASHRIVIILVLTLLAMLETTRLTVTIETTVTTVATIATWTAVATITAVTTLWTRSTLTLYVSFRFRQQGTMREFVFSGLRVNLHQFHLNLVTLLDTSLFDCLKTFPIDF